MQVYKDEWEAAMAWAGVPFSWDVARAAAHLTPEGQGTIAFSVGRGYGLGYRSAFKSLLQHCLKALHRHLAMGWMSAVPLLLPRTL